RVETPLDAPAAAEVLGAVAGDARGLTDLARAAAAQAVRYARHCHPGGSLPLRRIVEHRAHGGLLLDPAARAHLEIVESPGGRDATLLAVLDRTRTAFGARLLRRRLLAPLTDVARIRRRLDVVELFVGESALREALRGELARVTDLERLGVRVERGEASPRDLGALRDGLTAAARAVELVVSAPGGAFAEALGFNAGGPDTAVDVRDLLTSALVEKPPTALKEGGVFQAGFDGELDEADALVRGGAERMTALEAELRTRTGIGALKVRYTRVFGWYVEVSRGQAARVPEGFRRKQTVATGERYTLPEVEDLADRIAHAEDRRRERELALFGELASRVARAGERIAALAAVLARWDVAAGLADLAHRADYRRPLVDDSDHLELTDARHPVVERLAAEGRFVPNDVALSAGGERLWIVTGPNMAGKSTLLRQVALAVVLAQMGSFVPARSARIGVVDRVLSRVGASDNLARGESTFMVEMRETASILRGATARSLVILDEIGRGTSTFDGLAIAWAVAEYLDEAARCRTLFATHYHELTALGAGSPHVANVSVSAEESGDDIVFLHRLERRAASRSYGVAVARLAGLPESVLARARAVLGELEAGGTPGGAAGDARGGRPRAATA
ncbi:MAG: DNA mismatch repair protein MutS, partial [Deltaproteobacteria bacterium]|nr:DNA mismatch repair protein MutS [Deltaproteobacteria bacterium]